NLLSDSGARCIVIVQNSAHVLDDVISDTSVRHVITTEVGDLLNRPKGWLVNFVLKHVRKQVPPFDLEGSVTFAAALKSGEGKTMLPVELGLADIAFLQYTGG